MAHEEMMAEMNRIMRRHLPRQSRTRFWTDQKSNRYFWTTGKTHHKGKEAYVSGIYRFYKTKKQYKLIKDVCHAKRYKAKERAYKLFQKALQNERGATPPHTGQPTAEPNKD